MELSTLIGLVLAAAGLLGGMYFKHVPFSALGNPAAIFIILVGTMGAVFNAFPMNEMARVPALFKAIFTNKKTPYSDQEAIELLSSYAILARKEGTLALEGRLNEIKDPFMRQGIELMVMGQATETIEDTLMEDIEAMEQRHQANASVFSQAGAYAPTLGVLGAVIGLIAALGNMEDQNALGVAISAAFMATVYGIFTGYVLWHPFANKLKRKSKQEALNKRIIVEGVLLIVEGVNPQVIKDKLLAFMSQQDRQKKFGKGGASS